MVDDVMVAIMLLEESSCFTHGLSIFGFQSLPQDLENLFAMYDNEEEDVCITNSVIFQFN